METWKELEHSCRSCQKCALADTRNQVVFGDGNRQAKVLFVGEAPGANEDACGIPFVGRGGKLLTDMLALIDLDRSQYYIANMIKCRPPANRDPLRSELQTCLPYLRNQIALLKPQIIVCLGRISAMTLIRPDYKITKEHGQWEEQDGVFITGFYHPAALLRDPRRRPEAFEDVKSLERKMVELGMK